MPTFKQHVAHPRLAHNGEADAARACYLLIGAAILLNVLSDPQVHVSAPAAVLRERFLGREDRQQRRAAIRREVAGFSRERRATRIRAMVPLAPILDGNRYFNPTMPLPEAVCHGLSEALDGVGKRIPAFERPENLRHLLLGELEKPFPVALRQSGRCFGTWGKNFRRFAEQLPNTTGRNMQVLTDPLSPARTTRYRNPSPRLRPASPRLSQVGDEFAQLFEPLNALVHQIRV